VCTDDGTRLEASGEASRRDPEVDELVGQRIGSYRIERLIGRGGMGEVYLGVQPEIGSRVAIKVLAHAQRSGSGIVDRFFAEARAVNLIRHEGLVNILDLANMADGRPYIVMEYLEGAPLSEHVRRGPLPLGTLLRLMGELLDGLGAAHATGITHRDLKPDNVFITTLGRVKVLDFGIAKLKPELHERTPATHDGTLLGTPHYMSPEQARGLPADHRSDLYAVGVMLFECAAGRRPFEAGALYELLHLQITAPPPSLLGLRPDVPPALDALIARALSKDPTARFQSAGELARALEEVARFLPQHSFVPLSGDPLRGASLPAGSTLEATALNRTAHAVPPTLSATSASTPVASRGGSIWLPFLAGGGLVAVLVVLVLGGLFLLRQSTKEERRADNSVTSDPSRYDPDRFDVSAYFPVAKRRAQQEYPDAQLIGLAAFDVDSDGRARLAPDRVVAYTFRSPSNSPKLRDKSAFFLGDCIVSVTISSRSSISVKTQGNCNTPLLSEPRCNVREVVKRSGLPPGTRAMVSLVNMNGKTAWQVSRSSANTPTTVDDDCSSR
jgi:serine/threonine protein kinase